jgi:hypothetical protein
MAQTASQAAVYVKGLSVCQKTLGMLPEDGNVMLNHIGAAIHN